MKEKNSFNKYNYLEIIDQGSPVILENAFFSIKSSIEGLEYKPLKASEIAKLKNDVLQIIEIAQPHIYRISNFFEHD